MTVEPFQSLSSHVRQYDRLQVIFKEWHEIIKNIPSFGNPPLLKSMVIGEIGVDDRESNTFAVTLAGTTVYIRLDYLPGGEHGTDGILQAYVLESFTETPFLLTPITFKGNGLTQLKTQMGDEAMLDEQPGAFLVIGLLVKAAIERK